MEKTENTPIDKLKYEEAYAELEKIVSELESGEQPLEEALSLFERGQVLTKHCAELLAKAELKVQELSGDTLAPLQEEE
jgi:exodeoxyribonuclease VII small subunit